jgi:predicted kinase
MHLRIDTVEQGLRDLCNVQVEGEGYRLSYRIAMDNLKLGVDVVADSCNPIELTRREWEQVAQEVGATFINIEVLCSETSEHRRRIESRLPDIPGLKLPTWQEVDDRHYEPWSRDRIVVETAGRTTSDCIDTLIAALARRPG